MYSFCAMYSFRMSFCKRAGNFFPVGALLFRDDEVHGPQNRGGRIDGHRDGGLLQVDAVEEDLHVLERVDGDAALADFAFALRVVGVVAHQRGQIEGDRKAVSAMCRRYL